MSKYINPATDFGFKCIFKDEEITRGFLNALLKKYDPKTHIQKVTITDGELDETSKAIRRVIYDVHCTTDIDKWIFNLSNMETMESTLSFTNDIPLFKQLGKLASYSELSSEQQIQYDDSFNNYLAYMGQQEYKLKEGIKIGWEKGEAKGRKEGRAEGRAEGERAAKLESARKMKSKGYSIDIIADITGLTPDEIAEL